MAREDGATGPEAGELEKVARGLNFDAETAAAFATLGVPNDATFEEAQRIFRGLARKHHPDKGGDVAEFHRIEDAWNLVQAAISRHAFPSDLDAANADDLIADFLGGFRGPSTDRPIPEEMEPRPASPRPYSSSRREIRVREPIDWRETYLPRHRKEDTGIEKINATDAANLFQQFPNGFLALRALQEAYPDLCLHDAIKAKFDRSVPVAPEHAGALRSPLAIIDYARDHVRELIPLAQKMVRTRLSLAQLGIDLEFIEDYVRTQLSPKLLKRPGTDLRRG